MDYFKRIAFMTVILCAATPLRALSRDYLEETRLSGEIDQASDARDNDRVILLARKLLKTAPRDAEAWFSLGYARFDKGEIVRALADFDAGLRLAPANTNALRARARIYLRQRRYAKAVADCDAAIRHDAMDTEAMILRGNACSDMGVYHKAMEDFSNVTEITPDNSTGFNEAAWLYATCPRAELRDGAKAFDLALHACELSQWRQANLIDTLAATYAELGKWDEALAFEKMAMQVAAEAPSPDDDMAQFKKDMALFKRKKPFRQAATPLTRYRREE